MSTALSTLSRFFSPRHARRHDPDPADMGTCFGLEMTLQPPGAEPEPAPEGRPVDAAAGTPPTAEAPAVRRQRWWQRAGRHAPKAPLAA